MAELTLFSKTDALTAHEKVNIFGESFSKHIEPSEFNISEFAQHITLNEVLKFGSAYSNLHPSVILAHMCGDGSEPVVTTVSSIDLNSDIAGPTFDVVVKDGNVVGQKPVIPRCLGYSTTRFIHVRARQQK